MTAARSTPPWRITAALLAIGWCGAWLLAPAPHAEAMELFETSQDRAAQADLRRLAEAEHRHWTDHGAYAVSFADLGPEPFEPAKDVYVQVEVADDKNFRAIAMPRNSTTARVFALVGTEGRQRIIELDDEEVSAYVLGALKPIKRDQALKSTLAAFFTLGWLGLVVYGVIMHGRGGRWSATLPYFFGLVPLYVTLILSTYVDEHTYIGPLVIGMAGAGALAGLLSVFFGVRTLWRLLTQDEGYQLRRLALVGVMFAILGMISPFYTFYPYLPWIGDLTTRPAAHRILPP
ncbi:MAG: hypothetical protein AB1515_02220 [Nitrospirota bacterium]